MPREDAIIFADLIGKLDMLCIECAKCGRKQHRQCGKLQSAVGRGD